MWKYTVGVDGMMCGMCESHVNDTIRRAFSVKKVTSSHGKACTVIETESELDETLLRKAITDLGYTVGDIRKEPYQKKKWFARG